MNKKITNTVILLLIALAAASPYFVGIMVEKNFKQTVNQLNVLYAGEYKFSGDFARGYAHSDAKILVTKDVDPAFKYNLTLSIQHGPVIFEFHGWPNPATYVPRSYHLAIVKTELDDSIKKILDRFYVGKESYTMTTVVDFHGNQTTELKINPVIVPFDNKEFDWGGLLLTVNNDPNLNSITGNIVVPKLAYIEGALDPLTQKMLAVKDIKVDFTSSVTAIGEHVGVNVANISVSEGSNIVARADKLSFSLTTMKTGDVLKSDILYNIDKMQIEQDVYGPIKFQLKISNLNAKVLQDLVKEQSKVTAQGMQPVSATNLSPEQMLAVLTLVPTADMDLKMTLPKGKLEFAGTFTIGSKDLKTVDTPSILATLTAIIKLSAAQPIVYEFMGQYAEDQLHKKEREFFMTNKDPQLKNPYTLAPADFQASVEGWIIYALDKLKFNNIIIEKDGIVNTNASFAKQQWTFNGKAITDADWKNLETILNVNVVGSKPNPGDTSTGGAAGSQPAGSTVAPTTTTTTTTTNIAPDGSVTNTVVTPAAGTPSSGTQSISTPTTSTTTTVVPNNSSVPSTTTTVETTTTTLPPPAPVDNATATMEAIQRGKLQVIPAVKGGAGAAPAQGAAPSAVPSNPRPPSPTPLPTAPSAPASKPSSGSGSNFGGTSSNQSW